MTNEPHQGNKVLWVTMAGDKCHVRAARPENKNWNDAAVVGEKDLFKLYEGDSLTIEPLGIDEREGQLSRRPELIELRLWCLESDEEHVDKKRDADHTVTPPETSRPFFDGDVEVSLSEKEGKLKHVEGAREEHAHYCFGITIKTPDGSLIDWDPEVRDSSGTGS